MSGFRDFFDPSEAIAIAQGKSLEELHDARRELEMTLTAGQVARQIANERGISMSRAYRIAAEERKKAKPATEATPTPGWSKKDYILEALYRINANAGVGAESLASHLKAMGVQITLSDTLALCWDLQKQNEVAFNENHTGSGSRLTRIRLTPKGRAKIVAKRGTPQQAAERVNADSYKEKGASHSLRRGGTHQVGVDKTYFRNHRKVAEGGPVEIISEGHKPEIIPAPEYVPPKEEKLGDPLPQNMKAPIEDADVMYASRFRAEYPLIAKVMDRAQEREYLREKAAKMVEAASMVAGIDDEAAEMLMSRAADLEGPDFSSFEKEVMKLVVREIKVQVDRN